MPVAPAEPKASDRRPPKQAEMCIILRKPWWLSEDKHWAIALPNVWLICHDLHLEPSVSYESEHPGRGTSKPREYKAIVIDDRSLKLLLITLPKTQASIHVTTA